MEAVPMMRRRVAGVALSAATPLVIVLFALCVPPLFPNAHAVTPGPDYTGIGARIEADARSGRVPVDPDGTMFSVGARARRAHLFARVRNDEAFNRLGEPVGGEWLAHFHEPGQSYGEYVRSDPNRRTPQRGRLHLLPYHDLSPLHRSVLVDTRALVAAFFDSEVVVLPTQRVSPQAWSSARGQWDAELVADDQLERVPDDSLGVLGLMGGDLWAGQLRFVFGIGRFRERVGVHSLHRYGEDRRVLTERAFKLASHELGHMFGIEHCVFYECVMNGVNSLAELDESSPHLCPVCHEKLRHALGFDAAERYEQLASVYASHDMTDEAAFVRARAAEH
jgi:archaemetzincin